MRPRLRSVFLFQNGLVAVFDENGDQVPELQGRFRAVADRIKERIDERTELVMSGYGDRHGYSHSTFWGNLYAAGLLWDKEEEA
jgi:hypothetical protein